MSWFTPLSNEDIEKILNPPPNKPFVILADGSKVYSEKDSLPDPVVGSFQGSAGQRRRYQEGNQDVIAYKTNK